jgi:hypothetical protein
MISNNNYIIIIIVYGKRVGRTGVVLLIDLMISPYALLIYSVCFADIVMVIDCGLCSRKQQIVLFT